MKFSKELLDLAQTAQDSLKEDFTAIEAVEEFNQQKVLSAFGAHRISLEHLQGSSGYGYGDRGRDALENVYATVFGAQSALVRQQFVSGTHTLAVALFGLLRPGHTMLGVTGTPYDTLHSVLFGAGGSLEDFGVKYSQVELTKTGEPNYPEILKQAAGVQLVYIQRSRGYAQRPAMTIGQIEQTIKTVRKVNPCAIIMVDNCYGEFVERLEPTQVGADIIAGSLIKNPGGGLAQTGGYIAGRSDLVELCAARLTIPGAAKELGASLGENKPMYQGFFIAPSVVASALKTVTFAGALLTRLGFSVSPVGYTGRSDIVLSVDLGTKERAVAFCQGIQYGSPIDSYVTPEPWDMPGYDDQVIMAAGTFNTGASIELSADAPMREPYTVYLQGGITYYSGKAGVLCAVQQMIDRQIFSL